MTIEDNWQIMDTLEKLIKAGKKRGMLTVEEVSRALVVECDASKREVEQAFAFLEKNHILVINGDADEDNSKDIPADDAVRVFLNSIGKYPLLTAKEEQDLSRRIKEGDNAAFDKLVMSNLRLVVSVAKKYIGKGLDLEDLIQNGCLGVMTAARKFDYEKGYRFSTYATWWIRQTVTRAISDTARTIHIPNYVKDCIDKMNNESRLYEQQHGSQPTPEYLAEKLGEPLAKILFYRKIMQHNLSLYDAVGEDGDTVVLDLIEDTGGKTPESEAMRSSDRDVLMNALSTLEAREQIIIRCRYGFDDGKPKTLKEVGELFGITRERVRQIEIKALRKLRMPGCSNEIRQIVTGQ